MSHHSAVSNITNELTGTRHGQQIWRGPSPKPTGGVSSRPAVEEILPRPAPIDFRANVMPIGSIVQTGIHHVSVPIRRITETQSEILTPVSWARSVWEMINFNAILVGFNVKETN